MANSAVVGTLRAILSADTAEFASAMNKAAVSADQASKDIAKTGQAFQALEPRMASVTRLVKDFSGSFERRSADEFAMAIERVGGAARLSERELSRASGVFSDYISKARALGQEVPPHIAKVSSEIEKLEGAGKKGSQGLGFLDASFARLTAAFTAANLIEKGITAIIRLGTEAIASAGHLVDLSAKTGASIEFLQRASFVAKQTGSDINDFTNAMFRLGVNIADGSKQVTQALAAMGLAYQEVRSLKPEAQFELIAQKLAEMEDPQRRNQVAVDLFGRSVANVIPAIVEGYTRLAREAPIASDAQIRALDRAADRWAKFKDEVSTATAGILGQMVMDFERAASGWEKFFGDVGATIKGGAEGHRQYIQGLREAARVAKETADAAAKLTPTGAAIGKSAEEVRKLEQAAENARRSADEANKAYRRWADTVTGAALQREVDQLNENFLRLAREGKVTGRVVEEVWKQVGVLADKGAKLPPMLQLVNQEFIRFTATGRSFFDTFSKGSRAVETFTVDVIDFNEAGKSFFETFGQLSKEVETFTVNAEDASDATDGLSMSVEEWDKNIDQLADSLQQMAQITGDSFGDVAEWIGKFTSSLRLASQTAKMLDSSLANFRTGKLSAGFVDLSSGALGAVAAMDQATESGTKSIRAISGAAAGAKIGSMFGPWGTAIGAGVGALVGALRGAQNNMKKAREEFAKGLGMELGQLFDHLKSLGAEGEKLADIGLNVIGKNDSAANRKWMEDVTNFLIEVEKRAQRLNQAFGTLTSAAADFGGKVPAALQPLVQQLLLSNKLTEEQRALLQGLSGAPEWQQLQAIAEKYGITLESLGQNFQDARLTDIAMQYARDFMTLRDSGADVSGVLQGMKDEVQELVLQSLKFGVALPEALREVVEGLIGMGQLVDENGNALTDLTRINFKGTIEDAFVDIKGILEEIRDLLAGGLPKAAQSGAKGVEDEYKGAFRRIRQAVEPIRIPIEFDVGSFSPPEGFGISSAQEGGMVTKTGLVNVHAGEVIGPLDQLDLGSMIRIDNRLYIDGRELTTQVFPHFRRAANIHGVRPLPDGGR